jgi:transcriptional regulator with XRE-family HTH domain
MAEKGEFQDRLARIFDFGTMAEIARRLDLPHATIRNYFGGRLPSPEVLIKIADATNVSLNWLLTGKGEMYAGKPKGLDIGIVLEERIAEIVDRKLAERFEPESLRSVADEQARTFDIEDAIEQFRDPNRVMSEWFRFEGREYPQDFGVVFFQGWGSFSPQERLDALRDAKKVLDRTLSKQA